MVIFRRKSGYNIYVTFPCKVISSFYDNYYNIHKYDDIKKITFRIQNIDTEFSQEILNYFK